MARDQDILLPCAQKKLDLKMYIWKVFMHLADKNMYIRFLNKAKQQKLIGPCLLYLYKSRRN